MSVLEDIAQSHEKLRRGRVWCKKCGRTEKVDAGDSMTNGWPGCCGETMTIDPPEEWREKP